MANPRPVLLVGSVPLPTARDVFATVASTLGDLLARIPDGETGERLGWIQCQHEVLAKTPGLEVGSERVIPGYKYKLYRIADGKTRSDVRFGPLGYADWARDSYAQFRRLKLDGKIPAQTRFQVSLPAPFDVVMGIVEPSDVGALWPVYERAMIAELGNIAQAIPAEELAIQWDMALEFVNVMENPEIQKHISPGQVADAVARVAAHVPAAAELGFHCCYGDPGHKHIVEPTDTANMVALCNLIIAATPRPIAWIHMPVPKERSDTTYFAPLKALKKPQGTELYLGLVHLTDGVAGATRRIDAAKPFAADFGVATECGFGRRPQETIPALLDLHRQVTLLH